MKKNQTSRSPGAKRQPPTKASDAGWDGDLAEAANALSRYVRMKLAERTRTLSERLAAAESTIERLTRGTDWESVARRLYVEFSDYSRADPDGADVTSLDYFVERFGKPHPAASRAEGQP